MSVYLSVYNDRPLDVYQWQLFLQSTGLPLLVSQNCAINFYFQKLRKEHLVAITNEELENTYKVLKSRHRIVIQGAAAKLLVPKDAWSPYVHAVKFSKENSGSLVDEEFAKRWIELFKGIKIPEKNAQQYAKTFERNSVAFTDLRTLTDARLRDELGVSIGGDRLCIRCVILQMNEPTKVTLINDIGQVVSNRPSIMYTKAGISKFERRQARERLANLDRRPRKCLEASSWSRDRTPTSVGLCELVADLISPREFLTLNSPCDRLANPGGSRDRHLAVITGKAMNTNTKSQDRTNIVDLEKGLNRVSLPPQLVKVKPMPSSTISNKRKGSFEVLPSKIENKRMKTEAVNNNQLIHSKSHSPWVNDSLTQSPISTKRKATSEDLSNKFEYKRKKTEAFDINQLIHSKSQSPWVNDSLSYCTSNTICSKTTTEN